MEVFYSSNKLEIGAETKIRYGKQSSAANFWKEIIGIEDNQRRKEKIDEFIEVMEKNKEENGFFCREDVVKINEVSNGFKLDDKELYYEFFDTLRNLKKNYPQEPDFRILFHGVLNTVKNYFGGFNSDRNKRQHLTRTYVDENDEYIIPSIANQKGKNCSLCVERASVSHNLWLLLGEKSHYVNSKDCKIGNGNDEYRNDGHAFCIVEIDGVYKLFDPAMEIYMKLEGNPIDKMLKGEPFKVKNKNDESFLYANASVNKLR